ncbi:MAG TPA: protein kinase [Vicinamibacterales bacterium]|nr:protein kinase [Vicinamibacterales bacterium]
MLTPLGAGGMGEVYRARDAKLNRDVAIKVLLPAVADDPDRLARFSREAQVLASLNHPNIAHIHGIEESSGVTALVMELVEGEDLSQRIARGPMPIDEALPIARQIAEALEAAHEQGVIHRDLKPANIKVRPDGTVKVLDFGLAKALEPTAALSATAANSPTLSLHATQAGMILGTAAYMAPEQARGHAVDKRADVWAFGAVLYEMLTGTRAFPGDEVADVLSSVLAREPDWTVLPVGLSPVIGSYIKRCLYKDRKQRIRDIGDVLLALDGAFDASTHVARYAAVAPPLWRRALPGVMTAIVAALLTGVAAWRIWPSLEPRPTTRFDYVVPENQPLANATQRPVIATSPDGRSYVYQTTEGLYLRSMGDLEARLIPGTTEDLSSPFFSPDGQWVGYWAATGQLKKIGVSGGAPVTLCGATIPFGLSWASNNTILFGQHAGIMRVSANGGAPELIIRAGDGEQMYGPQLLPDGMSVLFSVTRERGPARWDVAQVVAQSSSSGKRTVIIQGGSAARYVPTGHIIYALRDEMLGVRFDVDRLTVIGGAVPLVQGVQRTVGVRAAGLNYAVSDQGTLVYLHGSASLRSLIWVNRNGAAAARLASIPTGPYEDPRLSPDGRRVLVTKDGDIWVYDVGSGRSSLLTRDGSSRMGVWDPSGSQVAYSSARSGNLEAWVQSSDGSGPQRKLTDLEGQVHVDSWSPDGRMLTLHQHPLEGPANIFMRAMRGGDQRPELFFKGDFGAESAQFSPDGHYVAYLSQETGQRELYIRRYPEADGQVTVSAGGGREPVWAPNGDLFYRSLTGDRMFAVSVTTAPTLKVGTPVQLFDGRYYIASTGSPRAQYDVTADGQRFLMLGASSGPDSSTARPHIVVVQNWFEELKARVPTK